MTDPVPESGDSPRPPAGTGAVDRHRVITTAGHVDHGKSTLLRALTGMEPDRLDEERRRGLSIELGFVWTILPATAATSTPQAVAFVDVPGHRRFLSTMLAGSGASPAALFVVGADDGWSEQSSEHRDALDLLGVPSVVRVVSKADAVVTSRLNDVLAEVERATAGTSLAAGPIVVTDAVSGRGIDELKTILRDRLAALVHPSDVGRPRLWLDRAFSVTGAGTVVTGTLMEGRLGVGDSGTLMRTGALVRIKRLQSLGQDVESAQPGSRVAANLGGVSHDDPQRGDALVVGEPWRTTRIADLWIRVLADHQIDRRGTWQLHVGTAAVGCRLRPLTGRLEANTHGAVRVHLDQPLPLVAGDRVVLREAGRQATVAGGVVADPVPTARIRGTAARTAYARGLKRVVAPTTSLSGRVVIDQRHPPHQRLVELVELVGGSRDAIGARAAAGLRNSAPLPDELVEIGSYLVNTSELRRWTDAVLELGPGTHDRGDVAARARSAGAPSPAARGLAEYLTETGVLVRTTHGVALPEHADAAADARETRLDAVVRALAADPFAPPDIDVLTNEYGLDHRERAELVSSGRVVRCGQVAFGQMAIQRGAALLRQLEADVGPFTASQARQALGTTRRYAIPLLDHLERTGAKRFDGQLHRMT